MAGQALEYMIYQAERGRKFHAYQDCAHLQGRAWAGYWTNPARSLVALIDCAKCRARLLNAWIQQEPTDPTSK